MQSLTYIALTSTLLILLNTCSASERHQSRLLHHQASTEIASSTGPPTGDVEGSGEISEFSSTPSKPAYVSLLKTSAASKTSTSSSSYKTTLSPVDKNVTEKAAVSKKFLTTESTLPTNQWSTSSSNLSLKVPSTTPTPATKSPAITVRITKPPREQVPSTASPLQEPDYDTGAFRLITSPGPKSFPTTSTLGTVLQSYQAFTTFAATVPSSIDHPEATTKNHLEVTSAHHPESTSGDPPVDHPKAISVGHPEAMPADHPDILEAKHAEATSILPTIPSLTEPHSLAVLCYDVYQHCLLSQTSRFGVDPIGPYFVDEHLLPQFCQQHDEIVQPCLAKTLQWPDWDRALEQCSQISQQDDQSSTTAYMMIRASRTWQFLCQLHKLHKRNDSNCFREKLTQCVLNMDSNFLAKCQTPCDNDVKIEAPSSAVLAAPDRKEIFDRRDDLIFVNGSLEFSKSARVETVNPFLPWSEFPKKNSKALNNGMDAVDHEKEVEDELTFDNGHEIQRWLNKGGRNRLSKKVIGFFVAVCIFTRLWM